MNKSFDLSSGLLTSASSVCESKPQTWFQITMTENDFEFACSERSGINIGDCISNKLVVAQLIAAAERIHNELHDDRQLLRKSSEKTINEEINLSFEIDGISDANLDLNTVFQAVGVPDVPKMQHFTTEEVTTLLCEVLGYEVESLVDLDYGNPGDTIQIRYSEKSGDNNSTFRNGVVNVSYHDIELKPMTVNDLGNFLHAYKHHGDEVALATMIHINERSA